MKKYIVKIPLEYEKKSMLNKFDSSGEIEINIKPCQLEVLTIYIEEGDFFSEEKVVITIENNLFLTINCLYGPDENYVIDEALLIIEPYMPILSFIVQTQNSNQNQFHPKIAYDIRNLQIIESEYNKYQSYLKKKSQNADNLEGQFEVYDSLKMKDSVHFKISQEYNVDDFMKIRQVQNKNIFVKSLLSNYYLALGNNDYFSKYFNLFVIIESLETYYKAEINKDKIFNDAQIHEIMSGVSEIIIKEENSSSSKQSITNRIKDLISAATESSRKQKLVYLFNEILLIDSIEKAGIYKQDVDFSLISKLVNTRNQLFHAKSLSEQEKTELISLTNSLLILCEKIILKIIDTSSNE